MNKKANVGLLFFLFSAFVFSQSGCVDEKDKVPPLIADFAASPRWGKAPLEVHFTDKSIGHITSWEWGFDLYPGVEATTQNPTWVFTYPGEYSVGLKIAGPSGSSGKFREDYITVYRDIIYVDGNNGSDANMGESWSSAVRTIQRGLDLADTRWLVLVADGAYTGEGNKNLDFGGREPHLRSAGGAANCIIDCEEEDRAFHFHSHECHLAVIDGFTIRRGYFSYDSFDDPVPCGGAILCEDAYPTIRNCLIEHNNLCNGYGGAIYCESSSIKITNCTITNNSATRGGAICCIESSPCITNCNISSNSASMGGGLFFRDECHPEIFSCAITDNRAAFEGGGIYCDDWRSRIPYYSTIFLFNCTVANNSSDDRDSLGGGICVLSEHATLGVRNTIFWGNTAASGNQVYTTCSTSAIFCCLADGANDWGGSGTTTASDCIHLDPLFTDPSGQDYHLDTRSPCIDVGDNFSVEYYMKTDLDGNPRIVGGSVDLGAYEKQ